MTIAINTNEIDNQIMRIISITLAIFLFTFSTIVACGEAKSIELSYDDYDYIEIEAGFFDKIAFSFSEKEGKNIDVMLMNETFFDVYQSSIELGIPSNFYYYKDASKVNASKGEIDFRVLSKGTYYIVIDNTNLNENGAPSQKSIAVDFAMDNWANPFSIQDLLIGVGAGVFTIIALIAANHHFWKRRERKRMKSQKYPAVVVRRTVIRRTVGRSVPA